MKLTVRESARLTIREVAIFWAKAQIPVRVESHSVEKLEKLFNEWKNLHKSSKKESEFQRQKESQFVDKLPDLFDIAHGNALKMLKNDVDKQFLISQRQKGRQGCLTGIDVKALQKEQRKQERSNVENERKRRYLERNTKSELCEEICEGYFSNIIIFSLFLF